MTLGKLNSFVIRIPTFMRYIASRAVLLLFLLPVVDAAAQSRTNGWSVNSKKLDHNLEHSLEHGEQAAREATELKATHEISEPDVEISELPSAKIDLLESESETISEVATEQVTFIEENKKEPTSIADSQIGEPALPSATKKQSVQPIVRTKRTVEQNLEYKDTLRRQYQAIEELAETEDAFNEQFGELYLAYARSLLKVGELDQAREMFANALHNAKVNYGVNGLEQRPVLRELFTMNLSIGNAAEAEKQLKRLVWLDSSIPEDTYSYDMVMTLANYYLDQFLMTPSLTEDSLIALNKAIRCFSYVVRRYNDVSDENIVVPYGDGAYAHFLKKQVRASIDDEVFLSARKRSHIGFDRKDTRASIDYSYTESQRFFKLAFAKAVKESDYAGMAQALVSGGDVHLLYGNQSKAKSFYKRARKVAGKLPESHPLLNTFTSKAPIELPAFELSVKRDPLSYGHSYQVVPMLLDVNVSGYVGGVRRQPEVNIPMGMRIRAKDTAKTLRFRPIMTEDDLVAVKSYEHDVKVRVKDYSSLANTDSDE